MSWANKHSGQVDGMVNLIFKYWLTENSNTVQCPEDNNEEGNSETG